MCVRLSIVGRSIPDCSSASHALARAPRPHTPTSSRPGGGSPLARTEMARQLTRRGAVRARLHRTSQQDDVRSPAGRKQFPQARPHDACKLQNDDCPPAERVSRSSAYELPLLAEVAPAPSSAFWRPLDTRPVHSAKPVRRPCDAHPDEAAGDCAGPSTLGAGRVPGERRRERTRSSEGWRPCTGRSSDFSRRRVLATETLRPLACPCAP